MHRDDSYYDAILKEAGCSGRVIAHCHAVRDLSLAYADGSGIFDRGLVNSGALLHDIGRGVTHSLHHAQAGAEYCRNAGLPPEVARIVECHTGAGLTSDECTLLGLLPIDCMPQTGEEKLVANADNLMKGTYGSEYLGAPGIGSESRQKDQIPDLPLMAVWRAGPAHPLV